MSFLYLFMGVNGDQRDEKQGFGLPETQTCFLHSSRFVLRCLLSEFNLVFHLIYYGLIDV
ncbi:MAG: hypothetical protein BGO33_03880 [Bacteroidia bacterium 43-41]|nr:MAG: hypothetical protein BGO33_03880 [Bacteroidia bacterium 43-41]